MMFRIAILPVIFFSQFSNASNVIAHSHLIFNHHGPGEVVSRDLYLTEENELTEISTYAATDENPSYEKACPQHMGLVEEDLAALKDLSQSEIAPLTLENPDKPPCTGQDDSVSISQTVLRNGVENEFFRIQQCQHFLPDDEYQAKAANHFATFFRIVYLLQKACE